jgi:hypothetical protein
MRYLSGIKELKRLAPQKPKEPMKVIWHYGPGGSGKNYDAKMHLGDKGLAYKKTAKTGFWWDGYEPDLHPIVIIDEVDKNAYTSSLDFLLSLMDEDVLTVQVKGGSRIFNPKFLFLTSTKSPREMFPDDVDYAQIIRRCDEVVQYTQKREEHCKTTKFITR